jgi:hypothetical protein
MDSTCFLAYFKLNGNGLATVERLFEGTCLNGLISTDRKTGAKILGDGFIYSKAISLIRSINFI